MELSVPGATLYYEVRGSGPALLMICGGPTDAGVFEGVAGILSDRYTVVTYDPRGNSRSIAGDPAVDQNMDVHGDDAAAMIAATSDGPAFVFGNSGGAQIGLNLTARHPQRVRALIAHEPPCVALLPDAASWKSRFDGVRATYAASGAQAAFNEFKILAGIENGPQPAPGAAPPPAVLALIARLAKNLDFFFAHGFMPLSDFVPDVATLRAGSVRVIAGAGADTSHAMPHLTARALATALGSELVIFPGDHGGYGRHAPAFAAVMDELYSRI